MIGLTNNVIIENVDVCKAVMCDKSKCKGTSK
jgi:hypothetical protein